MKIPFVLAMAGIVTMLSGFAALVYFLTPYIDRPVVSSYFEQVGPDDRVGGVRPFILRYKPTGQCILIVESVGITGGPIACPDEDR